MVYSSSVDWRVACRLVNVLDSHGFGVNESRICCCNLPCHTNATILLVQLYIFKNMNSTGMMMSCLMLNVQAKKKMKEEF